MSGWRDEAPTGRSQGEAREGSPRQIAEDYQLALLAFNDICHRRNGENNMEARKASARMRSLADELVAKVLGIREAGALADGVDRRSAPQPTRPRGSTIRTGWVKPVVEPRVLDHNPSFDLAWAIFNAKLDLISKCIDAGVCITSDPVRSTVEFRISARTVPVAMYVAPRGRDGYGSYLPAGQDEVHWYEEQGRFDYNEHMAEPHEGALAERYGRDPE